MSNTYGGQPPSGYGTDNPRNGITAALLGTMAQIQRPPGGMSSPGVPGLPPGIGGGGMSPLGGPPAGSTPPMGSTPGLGGVPPLGGGMALPGVMQPGQLPQGMAPQNVMGAPSGAPPLPMPPRSYG